MKQKIITTSVIFGVLGASLLLLLYFSIVTFISGWSFTQDQFSQFWYFILALVFGFGIQVGLFVYLRNAVKQSASPRALAVSGTTSTAAMVSCCAHYLTNFLPILGASGIIAIISQYQVQFFWIGLAFNLTGIAYMVNKVYKFSKSS